MTRGLPAVTTYSAASRSSSIVADVGKLTHDGNFGCRHDLGHYAQAGLCSGLGQQFEAFLPEPLEAVRRGPRFERSASQNSSTSRRHGPSCGHDAAARLDRTRTGHHDDLFTSHRKSIDPNSASVGPLLPGHESVGRSIGSHLVNRVMLPKDFDDRLSALSDHRDETRIVRFADLDSEAISFDQAHDFGLVPQGAVW
jgi:hypothetical protein